MYYVLASSSTRDKIYLYTFGKVEGVQILRMES